MAKVNNFIEFRINESDKMPEGKDALISVFFDALDGATKDAWSYSLHCTSSKSSTPDQDYEKVLRAMYKEGWSAVALKNLFEKYGKEIAELYNEGAQAAPLNAWADLFLYKMTNDAVLLSGMDYHQQMSDLGMSEFWIKFAYGYHRTPYGQLAIKQSFGNLQKWNTTALNNIVSSLVTSDANELPDYRNPLDKELKNAGLSIEKAKAALEAGYSVNKDSATLNLAPFKKALPHAEDDYPALKKMMIELLGDLGFKGEIGSINEDDDIIKLKIKEAPVHASKLG